MVRAFEDPDCIHVNGEVDPASDAEIVNLELVLADLAHVERRLEKATCDGEERRMLERICAGLREGAPARALGLTDDVTSHPVIRSMGLLTLKPVVYAFNVDEVDFVLDRATAAARAAEVLATLPHCNAEGDAHALVSARLEADVATRDDAEQIAYLTDTLGIGASELGRPLSELLSYNVLPCLVREMLGLHLVYTGPGVPPERSRTTRTHLVRPGITAEGLAARIHGDIQRGFVKAEVVQAAALVEQGCYSACKDAGRVRIEGRAYKLSDNDVCCVRWNA